MTQPNDSNSARSQISNINDLVNSMLPLNNPLGLPGLALINPTCYRNALLHGPTLQPLHIVLDLRFKICKREEVHILDLLGRLIALVLLDQVPRSLSVEGQHAASGVLDKKHLGGTQEVLGDDEIAKCCARRGSCIADDMGRAEGDVEGGGGVDARVHTGY